MKSNLMALHKQLVNSTSPAILLRKFTKEYVDWPNFKAVPQDAYEFWLKNQSNKVRREIGNLRKEKICLRTYIAQCEYDVATSIRRLIRYDFLDKQGAFKPGSRYGVGTDVYLPVHRAILKHLTNDEVVRLRCSVKKVPLEEALFLCDSPLTLEEAKERIQSLGLTSKVSIKGESWMVLAELPYDLHKAGIDPVSSEQTNKPRRTKNEYHDLQYQHPPRR